MRQYNAFTALFLAPLFSKKLYADVGTHWRGIGFWYLTFLLLLSWAVVLAHHTIAVNHYLDTDATTDFKDFPPITITRGIASSPVAQPYTMLLGGRPFCILDTTGVITMPPGTGAMMLITSTELIQQDRGGRIQRHALSQVPDGTYDQAWMLGWITKFRNLLLPVGAPLLTFIWLFGYLPMALIYSLIALGVNAMFRGKLTFAALLRLAIVAMTAPLILDTAVSLIGIPHQGLIWILLRGLTLAYLVFGVWAAADATRETQAFPVQFPGILPVVPLSPNPPADPPQFPV